MLLILIALLAQSPVTQKSTGANSPNIANVNGDVTLPPKADVTKSKVPDSHQTAYWKADRDVMALEARIKDGLEAQRQLPEAQKIRATAADTISKDCGGSPIINAAGNIDCGEPKPIEPTKPEPAKK